MRTAASSRPPWLPPTVGSAFFEHAVRQLEDAAILPQGTESGQRHRQNGNPPRLRDLHRFSPVRPKMVLPLDESTRETFVERSGRALPREPAWMHLHGRDEVPLANGSNRGRLCTPPGGRQASLVDLRERTGSNCRGVHPIRFREGKDDASIANVFAPDQRIPTGQVRGAPPGRRNLRGVSEPRLQGGGLGRTLTLRALAYLALGRRRTRHRAPTDAQKMAYSLYTCWDSAWPNGGPHVRPGHAA